MARDGAGELIAHGDGCLSGDAALAPIIPATSAIAGSACALPAPFWSADGMLHQAVISTPADHASAFQRLANTVLIRGPKNMAPR